MKKAKSFRRETTFEINENFIKKLFNGDEEFLKNELGFFKHQTGNNIGFTFGRPLARFENEGEGLPVEKDTNSDHKEFNLSFDLRLSHNRKGKIEILVAKKNNGRYFKFHLNNLTATQADAALRDFEIELNSTILEQILYRIIWACYAENSDSTEAKKESIEKIVGYLENYFKNLIDRKPEKLVEEIEKDGFIIRKYVPIEGGRNKGSKNKEPSITIEQIKAAISSFKYSVTFPTQTIIARRFKTTARTIQRCIKNSGITAKYNDFVHSILMEK